MFLFVFWGFFFYQTNSAKVDCILELVPSNRNACLDLVFFYPSYLIFFVSWQYCLNVISLSLLLELTPHPFIGTFLLELLLLDPPPISNATN